MTIYLECGEEKNTVVVDMGCYDTCIDCDKETIEYQYKKSTGGKWSSYGKWSEWALTEVTATNAKQVQTKVVTETYYEPNTTTKTVTTKPVCPSGYTLSGVKCISTTDGTLECPAKTGYSATLNGTTCTYTKTTDPTCPKGYTFDGSKCTGTVSTNPTCAAKDGWDVKRSGFTCTYTQEIEIPEAFVEQRNGTYMPSDTEEYHYVKVSIHDQLDCSTTCKKTTIYTYNVFRKAHTETKTETGKATCPSGYSQSGA